MTGRAGSAGGRSLGRVLDAAVELDPDRTALVVDDDVVCAYGQLEEAVTRVAAGLRDAGVAPGQRVPLADQTSILATAGVIACARIGAAAALMNPRLTGGEMAALVGAASTGPVAIGGPLATRALADAGCTIVLGADDLLGSGLSRGGPPGAEVGVDVDGAADAVVLFTSGTTGTPKAVPLANDLLGARIAAYAPAAEPKPTVGIMCVPFVHVGGMLGLMVALARGSTTVALTRFEAGTWLEAVERYRVNTCFLVPTMLHRIVEHPRLADTDVSSLQVLTYGAAPASPDLIRTAAERLPGVGLANTFGQTETLGSITILPPGDHPPERLASVGRPLPGVEIRVVDPDSLEDRPTGSVGELWVKQGMGATVDALAGDGSSPGWLRTGDLVSVDDDGYVYPAGRLSDTINRGGEKITPMEVEGAVRRHPAVRDVAAFAVPDTEMGSRVGVALIGADLTLEELRDFCRDHLAPFKLPEQLLVLVELPYNDFGKVDRKALRALVDERT
jgi:acyl-CoA synthetase (AMP-forming)/AMP-acid ligase II